MKEYYRTTKRTGNKIIFQGKKEMIKENICWDDIILPDALKNDIRRKKDIASYVFCRRRLLYQTLKGILKILDMAYKKVLYILPGYGFI